MSIASLSNQNFQVFTPQLPHLLLLGFSYDKPQTFDKWWTNVQELVTTPSLGHEKSVF